MKIIGLKELKLKIIILLIIASLLFINAKAINSTFEIPKIHSGDGYTNHWAVIIVVGGGQGYRHHAIWGLRSANGLKKVLIDHGWHESNIKFLFEEQATTDKIFNTFQWLNESGEDEDDLILFFFQGHGYNISEDKLPLDEPDGKDECYFPWDTEANGWSWDTYIIDDELGAKFDCLKSKNIIGIFETCHSGGWIDGSMDLCKSGRVILTSCDVNEASAPIISRIRWIFPHYVIQGLKGRADKNSDKLVSAEEAFDFAKLPTMIRSTILNFIVYLIEPVPLTQHPQIYDGWPTEDSNQQELKIIDLTQ
jgi:hypothetical protein